MVGKSALGNTLIGSEKFKSTLSKKSVTMQCEIQSRQLASGTIIKVADTPGFKNTEIRDVTGENAKAIESLLPGPNAFLLVLQLGRAATTRYEFKQLIDLFGDKYFLEHTIIIINRKDFCLESDDLTDIHTFMNTKAEPHYKDLYIHCGRRIVVVENISSSAEEKEKYAQEIIDMVIKMGGYYSHTYFQQLHSREK